MGDYQTEDGAVAQPRILMIQTSLTEAEYLSMDELFKALVMIDVAHHEVHEGDAFACHYSQTVSDTGDKSIIAFKTGNGTKEVHVVFAASASAPATAYILEAPTITDNTGATLAVYNRYRKSTNVSEVIDTSVNPDVAGQAMYFTETTMGNVTSGDTLDTVPLVAGAGPFAVGGAARGQQEWILKKNTLYAFVVESLDDADNTHRLQLDWYEHTPR